VIFPQHPRGNCIARCSSRLFFVACRNF
jgi:hypothetical protein